MINDILLYIGSAVIAIWGIAHIGATKPVVSGFGELSIDNKRTITMEWIAEGLTLAFIGALVLVITLLHGCRNPVSITVFRLSAGMLIALAVLSSFTGARTSVIPMKLCPYVKTTVAILFFLATVL